MKYITTAIDYVNSIPHIGTAYEKIGADILARFFRMSGEEVVLQMGNDEHSANVQKSAIEKGMDPKAYCDDMRPKFEEAWQKLNVKYDQFIQTSEERHHKSVSKLFEKIHENGDIFERDYEGWYCESCEAFYTDKDLEEGLCPNHKKKPKWLTEKNYFFKLSKYADFLLDYIEKNPEFILPAKRRNEVVSFIKQGLDDISVSRSSFDWGIPLPIDKNQVIYVWFDALINYITGAGFENDPEKFKNFWPASLHIIGKDITRFHCVIWPAMLKSAGVDLPRTVFGHGFVYLRGEKMSKSLGNVVTPLDIVEKYPDFGSDALRYYLMRTSSFGDDGDFTWEDFILRYNSDLANGVGNLVSRTLGMVGRYQDGVVKNVKLDQQSLELLNQSQSTLEQVSKYLSPWEGGDVQSHHALEEIFAYVTKVDQYIDQKQPWVLAKESKADELAIVMKTLIEAIRHVCLLLNPFIPTAVEKIWDALGFSEIQKYESLAYKDLENTLFLNADHALKEKKLAVFPRIDTKKEDKTQVKTEKKADKQKKKDSKKKDEEVGLIDIKDFFKTDLRVAKVLVAEKVEGADKLLKLQIELGEEKRQLVAGIAEFYSPEALIGKSVVVVANLKPAKIRGVESQGMLLAAKVGKTLRVVSPDGEIESNAKVG